MAQLPENQYAEDWLRWMAHRNYCLEVVNVSAQGGATVALVSGEFYEPDGADVKIVAVAANTTCIGIVPVPLADHKAGDVKILAVVRGPVVYNSDEIFCDAGQKAGAITALEALQMFAVNSALATWTTQTT